MNIAATQFTLITGAYEIYVSGCDGTCPGCHNPELADYTLGSDYRLWYEKIDRNIFSFPVLIKQIWILGGEPLLQNKDDLKRFLEFLELFKIPIVLFTRMEPDEVPLNVIQKVDLIKTGRYHEKEKTTHLVQYGISLASANQRIWTREQLLHPLKGDYT